MSGSGRKSNYRKSVVDSFLNIDKLEIPTPESIVLIKANKGASLFEVETIDGNVCSASLPHKFNKLIWIKRGDYVIVQQVNSQSSMNNTGYHYEIERVLSKDQIRHLKSVNGWPQSFEFSNVLDHRNISPREIANQQRQALQYGDDLIPDYQSDDSI